MTSGIKFCSSKDIGQGIVISPYCEFAAIQVITELVTQPISELKTLAYVQSSCTHWHATLDWHMLLHVLYHNALNIEPHPNHQH